MSTEISKPKKSWITHLVDNRVLVAVLIVGGLFLWQNSQSRAPLAVSDAPPAVPTPTYAQVTSPVVAGVCPSGELSPAQLEANARACEGKDVTVLLTAKVVDEKPTVSFMRETRNGFTLVVFPKLVPFLDQNGDGKLSEFQGSTLRVTGNVAIYNGSPEIIINDESQLEVAVAQQ